MTEPRTAADGVRCPFCTFERQHEDGLLTLREVSAHVVLAHGDLFHEFVAQVSREWDEQIGSVMARQSKAARDAIRAAALDEARAAVAGRRADLIMGPAQDGGDTIVAWAFDEALAAIDALREKP